MHRILILLTLLGITAPAAGQLIYSRVTAVSGTQTINGNTVTITKTTAGTINYCGTSPYWIGSATGALSNYSFAFSMPVLGVKIQITAMNKDEFISFTVNGHPIL